MTSYDLIIVENGKIRVNWESVLQIKEFGVLRDTKQNPIWHLEGDVLTHTMYVTNMCLETFGNTNTRLNRIMLMAALFHDIGKGFCTIEVDGRFKSPNHAQHSDDYLRIILKDDDELEYISFFVRHHMKPLELQEVSFSECCDGINSILDECDGTICTIDNLFKLKHCDCLGSIMQKDDSWREKLKEFREFIEIMQ